MTDDELTAAAADIFSYFDRREAADERMVRLKAWALSVLGWDGLLPAAVLMAPNLVQFLFPGRQGALELTFIIVPIVAFLIRMVNGSNRFRRGEFGNWQAVIFGLAILFLVGLDAALIMFHLINGGVGIDAWFALGGLYLVYLALMAIALFPLRATNANSE